MNGVDDRRRAPPRMPPRPQPPHDPLSLLLAGWIGPRPEVGWRVRALDDVEIGVASRALVLAPTPDAQRRAGEASGSFGGLRPPLNMALGPAGDVYLLDPVSGRVLRFDPCCCRFDAVPCFTRVVDDEAPDCVPPRAPRRPPAMSLRDPHAIAICGAELYIADSGHARIVQASLHGFLPRGTLQPPAAERAARARPWRPMSLAFNGRGELHAADPANRRIDVFDARGRWLRALTTARPAWHLAFDCSDRLHAVLADAEGLALHAQAGATRWIWQETPGVPAAPALLRFEGDTAVALDLRTDAVSGFAPPPFAVDASGFVRLPCACGCGLFDARGTALPPQAVVDRAVYRRRGRYLSRAMDSGIEGCPWHRVELRGLIPPGSRVTVRCHTAHIELDEAELALVPEAQWSAAAPAAAMRDGRWDCLVTAPPGRYAWLRLDLEGDGHDTPCLEAALVEYPRISLRRYLPAVYGFEPASADFTDRFGALFDTGLRSIERHLDGLAARLDPRAAPEDFLAWLAGWIGVAAPRELPLARRREIVAQAAQLYARRGTPEGLRRQLLLLLGYDSVAGRCLAQRPQARCIPRPRNCGPCPPCLPAEAPALLLEHFKLRRWLWAGRGRLGDDSVLWGRRIVNRSALSGDDPPPRQSGNAQVGRTQLVSTPDPLHDPLLVHAHRVSVFVPARVRERAADDRALRQLLAAELPAHVQADLHYVEPRFRVGVQAMVGLDSVIARTPQGVRLQGGPPDARPAAGPLGQATVLAPAPSRRGGPRIEVGEARVGTTTVLR